MRPRRFGFACPARPQPERSRSGKTPVLRRRRVARLVRANRSFASTSGKLFELAEDEHLATADRQRGDRGIDLLALLEPSPVVLIAHLSDPLGSQDRDPARSIPRLPRSIAHSFRAGCPSSAAGLRVAPRGRLVQMASDSRRRARSNASSCAVTARTLRSSNGPGQPQIRAWRVNRPPPSVAHAEVQVLARIDCNRNRDHVV